MSSFIKSMLSSAKYESREMHFAVCVFARRFLPSSPAPRLPDDEYSTSPSLSESAAFIGTCLLYTSYSGTAVYTKAEPTNVKYGIDGKYSDEGRLITLEYDNFYFIDSYTPNSQQELKRLAYRMEFEDDLRERCV